MENLNLSANDLELLDSLVEEALGNTQKVSTQILTKEQEAETIPEKAKSKVIQFTTSRFSSATWFNEIRSKSIILAGCGGIGSWTGLLLSRLLVSELILIDNDRVEFNNMGGQFYSNMNVGKSKVAALTENLRNFGPLGTIFAETNLYTENSVSGPIMICGFDNMAARTVFFNNWKKYVTSEECKQPGLFIDGRLAAEELQILCIKGDDTYNMERYEKEFLFTDAEADSTICSYKQTSFCANMIASLITNLFVNFCANLLDPIMERDLPFFTSYNAETMFLKTEA